MTTYRELLVRLVMALGVQNTELLRAERNDKALDSASREVLAAMALAFAALCSPVQGADR